MIRLRSLLENAAERYAVVSFESLAWWRMLLGAACAQVVLRRWAMRDLFYTETGAYPLAALAQDGTWHGGPLGWATSTLAHHLIFAACLLVTLAFAVGLWARCVKWLLLPALFTIDARAPALFTGGELVLHLQSLYVVLLPVGRALSVDSWLKRRAERRPDSLPEALSIRTAAYPLVLLQLAVIYFFNMLSKSGSTWEDGTALGRALGAATLVTHVGAWVARAPDSVLHVMTYGTLLIEGALPVLILTPWGRRYAHTIAAAAMVALHGGIFLTMEVGSFSLAMISHVPLLLHRSGSDQRVEVSSPRERRWRAVAVVALAYLMVARLGNDLVLFPNRPHPPLPRVLERVTYALGLWQVWMMFSPDPPKRDYVIVTDAVTRGGKHFDPWRLRASNSADPYTQLPVSVVRAHAFTRYENALSEGAASKMHPFFARWVLEQRLNGDPVERFDAWLMVIPTDARYVVAEEALNRQIGLTRLPLPDALLVEEVRARGVWAPERAVDGKIVPEGTHALTPVSASMSAGCPSLTVDLGKPRTIRSAFVQADAIDEFSIEGSLDGATFQPLGEVPRSFERHLKSRVVPLSGDSMRFVRIRPTRSRSFRHSLSELALFDHEVSLPPLPSRKSDGFICSLQRPAVVGIVSGTNDPDVTCPAEDFSRP